MIYFKKGSLVPRRIGILIASHKKAQHFLVFGVDAIFDGRSLKPVKPMGKNDALIIVKGLMSAPRKNGTRQKVVMSISKDWSMSSWSDTLADEYGAAFERRHKG